MRFILSTGSLYSYSIDRVFALAAEAGFDGIEVLIDHRWDTRQVRLLATPDGKPLVADPGLSTALSAATAAAGARQSTAPSPAPPNWHDELGAQVVVHHLPMRFGYAFLQAAGRNLLLPNPFDSGRQYATWLSEGYADASNLYRRICFALKTCRPSAFWAGASTQRVGTRIAAQPSTTSLAFLT